MRRHVALTLARPEPNQRPAWPGEMGKRMGQARAKQDRQARWPSAMGKRSPGEMPGEMGKRNGQARWPKMPRDPAGLGKPDDPPGDVKNRRSDGVSSAGTALRKEPRP